MKLVPELNSVHSLVQTNSLTEIGIKNINNDVCLVLVLDTHYLSMVQYIYQVNRKEIMYELIKARISCLEDIVNKLEKYLSDTFRTVEQEYGFSLENMRDIFSSDEILASIKLLVDEEFGIFNHLKDLMNFVDKPKAYLTEINLIKLCKEFYEYLVDIEYDRDDLEYVYDTLTDISAKDNFEYVYVVDSLKEMISDLQEDII